MNAYTLKRFPNVPSSLVQLSLSCFIGIMTMLCFSVSCFGQEESDQANVTSSIGKDGTGTIIVEAHGTLPEPQVFHTAQANADVRVGIDQIEQLISLNIVVIQGNAKTLSFGLRGDGKVTDVQAEELISWSVRQTGDGRFLDLHLKDDVTRLKAEVKIESAKLKMPASVRLTHLTPGDSVGFDSVIALRSPPTIDLKVSEIDGFAPLESTDLASRFQTTTGGTLLLSLNKDGASPGPIELVDTTLQGELHPNGRSVGFRLAATANVSTPNAEITILAGNAAVSEVPSDPGYRLRLTTENDRPVYKLVFPKEGSYSVAINFVGTLLARKGNGKSIDFTIGASAIVPLELNGFADDLEFHRDQESVVPIQRDQAWVGFLPATGRAKLQWKGARKTGEGKLFFTTTAQIEASVGTGLLRQDHQVDYQVLQGELKSLSILLRGPGEILNVQGNNLVGWKVNGKGEDRQLDITLSQPITATSQFNIRSQTALGAFPMRVEGMRLEPIGAIRHSGFLRIQNSGLVRLEPTGLAGLSQLSPDQFPGKPTESRQVFVYRFPSVGHAFTVAADRIQPEVNVSQLVLYQVSETDRVIKADVELDIREAPIREWDILVPADYSAVAVTGSSVSDYVSASESEGGLRNLKVIFGKDLIGRQLVTLHLEKSEPAIRGDWELPHIEYPGAKTVRGDIGIMGTPGFRISAGQTDLLSEKPLSYFPKPSPNLQQAFRIREPGWSATMQIELLDRSVQTDVFHLMSLSEETVYGSSLINYFVTGAPVSEWKIRVPRVFGNVMVDGQDVRTWRREGDMLVVSLHQPVMGAYTLLVTYEEKPADRENSFQAGPVAPIDVQGERGYIQVVSPMQVEISTEAISDDVLKLDPLELPAEFRLLSTAPPLGTWQYTQRPFTLNLKVDWFQPGLMVTQVVEFSEANSRVSRDGELVTDVLYFVKSRGQRSFKIRLPEAPARLWEVTVDGQPVTARATDEATLIPLPGVTDPNVPIEVRLRLGKPAVDEDNPQLALPIVQAPVLKTQWNVVGDDEYVLVPGRGTVTPPIPVLRPSGFDWVARRGLISLMLIALFAGAGVWGAARKDSMGGAILCLMIAIGISFSMAVSAHTQRAVPAPLQLSLPILAAGEVVKLQVGNTPLWRVNLSWLGVFVGLLGVGSIVWTFTKEDGVARQLLRCGGIFLIALGLLYQGDGASLFYVVLGLAILVFFLIPGTIDWLKKLPDRFRELFRKNSKTNDENTSLPGDGIGPVTSAIFLLACCLSSSGVVMAADSSGFELADSIKQKWVVTRQDTRLIASGTVKLSGHPGDRFRLLDAPGVLTNFEGEGLRLTKDDLSGKGLVYTISIPIEEPALDSDVTRDEESKDDQPAARTYEAKFEYQLEALSPLTGIPVLTSAAAVQEIEFVYDEAGWDVVCPTAVRVEVDETATQSNAKVLLGPGQASLTLKPKVRDVSSEETQFFVEASNVYQPGPGVVDGRHRLNIRTSQGQVSDLDVFVPKGLTVSAVSGPIGSWQFDADSGRLRLEIEPAQSQGFSCLIETQRGLDALPTSVTLAPLKVEAANGEVGMVGVAFGPEAQPEKLEATSMSAINLGDFDTTLITNQQAVLHRVYRYGADGGQLDVRVAPVQSEVRVTSKQVLSLGDERIVLAVGFTAEISRAGLFQLSFPLPKGLEVESLSGAALHHWSELSEGDERQIILHLNGKTIGPQSFALTLVGSTPENDQQWNIPRFELNEATRQTGELVVRPTTGIRLRTVARQNISETDPRTIGGDAKGSLAFRLLQRSWSLDLGVEKLDPWITGQVLHEVTLREGQTRSAIFANFDVQNASIRSMDVVLPVTDEEEIKTLRASGDTVSDFVRTAPGSDVWQVKFKRRVVGKIQFQIEFERRGDRAAEALTPAAFPQTRQLAYFYGIRAGGRLELEHEALSQGWQQVDWNMVPAKLREVENQASPAFALRAVKPVAPLVVRSKRHSLADALKLRVNEGTLTTVVSPTGAQLTDVDVTLEVIQRSSLHARLPEGGELFSIFVNGESVNSVRLGDNSNTWQFTILPGIDDRTAKVRFVYSVKSGRIGGLNLTSPELNVPLENIHWNVVAPKGFELTDSDGNLELVSQSRQREYDRKSYLTKVTGKRQAQAQQAAQLLNQANLLLQAGEQTKARWALNSVANQYALDAASNEDARVQLENLQTQQAIVGLNTRRQRLYLDNRSSDSVTPDNKQLREAAADNPILQQDQLNFRPQQLSQLLRGNTTEDNAVLQQLALRLVQHQRTTQPAPQAILISLPEEGSVYTFNRSVQVAENVPLKLNLEFDRQLRLSVWRTFALLVLLAVFATVLVVSTRKS